MLFGRSVQSSCAFVTARPTVCSQCDCVFIRRPRINQMYCVSCDRKSVQFIEQQPAMASVVARGTGATSAARRGKAPSSPLHQRALTRRRPGCPRVAHGAPRGRDAAASPPPQPAHPRAPCIVAEARPTASWVPPDSTPPRHRRRGPARQPWTRRAACRGNRRQCRDWRTLTLRVAVATGGSRWHPPSPPTWHVVPRPPEPVWIAPLPPRLGERPPGVGGRANAPPAARRRRGGRAVRGTRCRGAPGARRAAAAAWPPPPRRAAVGGGGGGGVGAAAGRLALRLP